MVGFELFLTQAGMGRAYQISDANEITPDSPYRGMLAGHSLAATDTGQQPARNVDLISQLDTPRSTVAVQGTYAYVGAGRWLVVLDGSDPTDPTVVSRTAVQGEWPHNDIIQGIYIAGNYALLVIRYDGLQVIDISDPSAPVKVGTYDVAGWVNDLYVVGTFAYVATSAGALQVLDISDPTAVRQVGYYQLPEGQQMQGIHVVDDYAYVLWQHCESTGYPPPGITCRGSLLVLDVSNPDAPARIGSHNITIEDRVNDIYVTRGYAYVAAMQGIWVVAVSDPTAPEVVGQYERISDPSDIYVVGSYIFVSVNGGFKVIKEYAPDLLREAGTYPTWGKPDDTYVAGNYAFVAASKSLRVIDVSDPFGLVEAGAYAPLSNPKCVHVVGSYAYVANWHNGTMGLYVVDISDPTTPREVGAYRVPGEGYAAYVSDGYAYLLLP